MKSSFALIFLLLSFFIRSSAQSPQFIPYQAVARNAAGNLLPNTTVCVQFRIFTVATGGTPVYEEHSQVTTNNLGLFNLNVGAGTVDIGTSLSAVSWGTITAFMEVGIDITGGCTGGNTYTNMGRTQMLSVPYALFAATAASGGTTQVNADWNASSGLAQILNKPTIPSTITLTGDVGGTGTTSIGTTIGTNAVTYAKFQQVGAKSLVGNPTAGNANAQGITVGTGLSFTGTTLGLTSNTISGVGLGSNLNALTIGSGLSGGSYDGSGAVTITNSGVTSAIAGTGIGVSGGTGAVTFTNTGVTSITPGVGLRASASTGAVTLTATGISTIGLIPTILNASTLTATAQNSGTYLGFTITASSSFSTNYEPWEPLTGYGDWCSAGVVTNYWIQVQFPVATVANRVGLRGRSNGEVPITETIEGSNDGSTFTVLGNASVNLNPASGNQLISFTNTTPYLYYRVLFPTSNEVSGNPGLCYMQFFNY